MPSFLQSVPKEYICMPNIKKSDKPWGIGKGWSLDKATSKAAGKDRHIQCHFNLKGTGIAVIDIDTNDYDVEQLFRDTGIDIEYTSYVAGNTTGWHIYVKSDRYNKNITKCSPWCEMDYLGEKVFEKIDKEWLPHVKGDSECAVLTDEQFNACFKMVTHTPAVVSTDSSDLILLLIDIIKIEYLDDRSSWCKILWAAKNCKVSEEFMRTISKKSLKFSDDGFDTVWKDTYPNITLGTIKYYARLSDSAMYLKLLSTHAFNFQKFALTDNDFAELFMQLEGDNYVLKCDELYVYEKIKWRVDNKYHILKSNIQKALKMFFNEVLVTIPVIANNDLEVIKKLTTSMAKVQHKISSNADINNIASMLIHHLVNNQLDKTIEFDMNPYLFCFQNKAYDLKTQKEVTITKEDYVLQNTHYDYVEPTDKQLSILDAIIVQIFPDPEVRKCYLSVLYAGMVGIQTEKLVIANGGGRNGKGLINEAFSLMLGEDYFYKLPADTLTTKTDLAKGASPQVANMDNKRFILSSEPEEGSSLQMGFIKDITGGTEINARQLYSAKTSVRMKQMQVLECNTRPNIKGQIGEAVGDRILDIPFISYFTSNETEWDAPNHIYPINLYFKTTEFKQEFRSVLFKYLLMNSSPTLYVPSCIVQRTNDFLLSKDIIYEWMSENYEFTNDSNDILKMKDVYHEFTESEFFREMDKKAKREHNKKGFIQIIASSVAFKSKYYNDTKKINGFTYGERIVKFKPRVDEGGEV